MLIFSGSSNQPLAEEIALNLKLNLAPSETVSFADGEVRVRILTDVKDQHVVVVQSLSKPGDTNLMELCQFVQILKREGAKKITAVIPYLAYARQHKAHRAGEAVSVSLVAAFLKTSGVNDCILLDIHEQDALKYFRMPVLHLSASDIFSRYIDGHRDDFGGGDIVIVAPDKGRRMEAENLASDLETGYAVIEKQRHPDRTDTVDHNKLIGNVKNKEVVIFDDLISTGRTAIMAGERCLENGAFHVYLAATHGVFAKDDNSFWDSSAIDGVYVTDSINIPPEKRFNKLQIVSVSSLIAKELQNYV